MRVSASGQTNFTIDSVLRRGDAATTRLSGGYPAPIIVMIA
jgi:hypothetical protein